MTPRQFVDAYLPTARTVAAGTRLDEVLFLAQWAHETGRLFNPEPGWAGAPNNLANIRDKPGSFAHYSSLAEFANAEIWTLHNSRPNLSLPVSTTNNYYWPVLATAGKPIETQIAALGASPWDAGHYGNPPGSALIPYAKEFAMSDFTDRDREVLNSVAGHFELIQGSGDLIVKKQLDAIQAAVTGGVPPADLTALTAKVDAIAATLAKIENALRTA